MIISWHGFNYFRLQNSHRSVILNPYSLDSTNKVHKLKSDIALFSDPGKLVANKFEKDTFIVDSPGEYEVGDIFIYGEEIKGNLVYLIVFEDMKIVFLGEFGHQELINGDLELIEGADILIVPVGGGIVSDAKEAVRVINQIEPRIVIPSCYSHASFKSKFDNIANFIKEFGVKPEECDKFKIQKKDLPQDDMKLVVLKSNK